MNTKIYKEIADARVITERQILLMKNRANKGHVFSVMKIFDNGPLRITPEQTKKGLDWLLDKWKTPMGKVRKRNPFNSRAQVILSHFDRFELVSFCSLGMYFLGVYNYRPVYRAISKKGMYFDYVANYFDKSHPVEIVGIGRFGGYDRVL